MQKVFDRRTLKIDASHKVIFDDFRNVRLDKKVDLIFTDPPFGIDFKGNHQAYNRTPDALSYVEINKTDYPDFIRSLIEWSYEALKDTGSMWLVSGWNNLRSVLDAIEETGFKQINHCIWKYQFGVYTKRKFTTSHYHLLLLAKNKKDYTFNKPEHYAEDVWFIKRRYHRGKMTAGNELPEELVEKCIRTSSNENDLVLDPCLGSGTTMKVCLKTNRSCLGIEINPVLEDRIREKNGISLSRRKVEQP